MIALSLRHRRNDIFWFTLFHELYHLFRHSKKETFVHTMGSGIDEDLESAADSSAPRLLIPRRFASELSDLTTAAAVEAFAGIGVCTGIACIESAGTGWRMRWLSVQGGVTTRLQLDGVPGSVCGLAPARLPHY